MTHEELCRMEQSQLIKLIDEGKLAQVVRCKDCKRNTYCKIYSPHFGENCFCSCGEEKEREVNGK